MNLTSIKQKLSLNDAIVVTSACLLATYLADYASSEKGVWVIMAALLLPITRFGSTFSHKILHMIATACLIAISVVVSTLLRDSIWFFPWIFTLSFLMYLVPRYLPGGDLAGIFIVVFAIFAHGMPVTADYIAVPRAMDIGIGSILGIVTVILFYKLPCHSKSLPQKNTSIHLIKRAFRVSCAILAASLVAYYFDIYNAAWLVISAMVISQNNLGGTVRRAAQRLSGTILGVVFGVLLSTLLFEPYPNTTMISFVFIFLLIACIRNYYFMAIFFGTCLLTNLFYYLDFADETIITFMTGRLIDTVLGIGIGLLAEILIFPNTIAKNMREDIHKFWVDIDKYMQTNNKEESDMIIESIKTLKIDIYNFRFEPISMLMGRYKLSIHMVNLMAVFFNHLQCFQITRSQHENDKTLDDVASRISSIMELLATRYYQLNLYDVDALEGARQELAELKDVSCQYKAVAHLIGSLDAVLVQYEKMVETPRWKFVAE